MWRHCISLSSQLYREQSSVLQAILAVTYSKEYIICHDTHRYKTETKVSWKNTYTYDVFVEKKLFNLFKKNTGYTLNCFPNLTMGHNPDYKNWSEGCALLVRPMYFWGLVGELQGKCRILPTCTCGRAIQNTFFKPEFSAFHHIYLSGSNSIPCFELLCTWCCTPECVLPHLQEHK